MASPSPGATMTSVTSASAAISTRPGPPRPSPPGSLEAGRVQHVQRLRRGPAAPPRCPRIGHRPDVHALVGGMLLHPDRSPSSAAPVNGETGARPARRPEATLRKTRQRPVNVDLPTPGAPVRPSTGSGRPGTSSRSTARSSGAPFSTSEISRPRAARHRRHARLTSPGPGSWPPGRGSARSLSAGTRSSSAPPCPPPPHSAAAPRPPPRRLTRSEIRVIRAPDAPIGWPRRWPRRSRRPAPGRTQVRDHWMATAANASSTPPGPGRRC